MSGLILSLGGRDYTRGPDGGLLVKRSNVEEPMIDPIFHAWRDPVFAKIEQKPKLR